MCIGHLQIPSKSPSESPAEVPLKKPNAEQTPSKSPSESPAEVLLKNPNAENPSCFSDSPSSPPAKKPRVGIESTCNGILDCNPQSKVGERLRVYWPMDNIWYEGRVKSYDKSTKMHVVIYDDGDEECLLLSQEKIEWIEDEYKINAPPHRFRRLKKLSENNPADTEDLNSGEKIVKDVSDTDPPSSVSSKQPLTPHLAEFNSEYESSEENDSDEDWGKNVKNLDCTDDDESEENASLEKESLERKRKRRPGTTQKGASSKKMLLKKMGGNSPSNRLKLETPGNKTKVEVEPIALTACKPLGSMQENANDRKSWKQDDDNSICEKLKSVIDLVSGSGISITLSGEVAERFGCRMTEKLKFLFKNRRDASGKQPGDPGYDPRTLYLPEDFVKGLSGGQRQWWEFKSQHMDKVLFFKMGKFYELFEMDAHIGVLELDLQYMKGEQPHCGFPEKNFTDNVEKLAQKGYRVLVVEQTETPDQLEQRRKATGSKDKVVKREICAVITKGTMTEGGMLATCADASYLLAITERSTDSGNDNHTACVIGICVADASTNRFILGQFSDDSARSRLCSVLSEIRPVELIKPSGILSIETEKVLRNETRKPLVNNLIPGKEFWDAETSLIEIKKLYALFSERSKSRNEVTNKAECVYSDTAADNKRESLPDVICQVVSAGESGQLALSAFGGCLSYLRQVLLDQSLLSFGKLEIFPCSDFVTMQSASDESNLVFSSQYAHLVEPYMVLDAAALENLEILENNQDGSSSGTLFAQIDHCVTGFGKRLLRKWLVRPLRRAERILERQDAIAELKGAVVDFGSAIKFRKELTKLPDMERMLARLYSSSGAAGRNADRVVLYEDAAKKQLQEFIAALHGCRCMIQACLSFNDSMDEIKSSLLRHILTPGKGLPDARSTIKHFENAFDWSEAEKTGRILPCEGVDKDYDAANRTVREIEIELEKHLEMQRKYFGSDMINYVTVGKEHYQIEIPESLLAKVPQDYEARSSRKGFRRFWTPKIKQLLQDLADAQGQREASLRGILQGLIRQFCEHHSIWHGIVNVVAEMDVLISLALASNYFVGPTCRPSIKDTTKLLSDEADTPYLRAKELGHPVLSSLSGSGCFVPNDVNIGGHRNACFMLLTGPNMGGKSTLLRQVCLAVILAQLGADVPAEEFEFSPVDRIFVRMGAKDHIMAGQSTFLVELLETASMLSSATRDSLVVLDELGRGTATSDGQAIAHAVLEHLAHETGCRGLFSTHYHHLATDFASDPSVGLYHMACKVGTQIGGLEEVTFLYKLAQGTCPKSYGVNVARLAGMPDTILERAAKKSAEFESQYGQRSIKCDGRPLASVKLKERNLIQEVLNIVTGLHSSGTTAGSDMRCLVEVWHRVASHSLSDCSHSKHSLVTRLFDCHPLHSTIPPGM